MGWLKGSRNTDENECGDLQGLEETGVDSRSLGYFLWEPGLPSGLKTALCRQILGCTWVVESPGSHAVLPFLALVV